VPFLATTWPDLTTFLNFLSVATSSSIFELRSSSLTRVQSVIAFGDGNPQATP
jgi:hypothetical protein